MTTPSDTPRSNEADYKWENYESAVDAFSVAIDLCHELERELNATCAQIGLLIAGTKQQERQIEFLHGRVKELDAVVIVISNENRKLRKLS